MCKNVGNVVFFMYFCIHFAQILICVPVGVFFYEVETLFLIKLLDKIPGRDLERIFTVTI